MLKMLILHVSSSYEIIEDLQHKVMINSHYFTVLGYIKHEKQDFRTT